MKITEQDLLYLKNNQPELKFTPPNVIRGRLNFTMEYNASKFPGYKIFHFNENLVESEYLIKDSYNIEINTDGDLYGLPVCFCVDKQINQQYEDLKDSPNLKVNCINDLHLNQDADCTFCLGFPMDFIDRNLANLSLEDYLEDFVVPFLYYQTYIFRNRKEPWRSYGHGPLIGLGEYFYEIRNEKSKANESVKRITPTFRERIKGVNIIYSENCICGSGRKWRDCHFRAAMGLKFIRRILLRG